MFPIYFFYIFFLNFHFDTYIYIPTYQFRRLHLVINWQIHRHVHSRHRQGSWHFAHILDIHDAQALLSAALLRRIRCHGQPVRPYFVDILPIDSFRRCRRNFRTAAFIAEHGRAIYRARSAFLRRMRVHPIGSDAFARFENKIRPFAFENRKNRSSLSRLNGNREKSSNKKSRFARIK